MSALLRPLRGDITFPSVGVIINVAPTALLGEKVHD